MSRLKQTHQDDTLDLLRQFLPEVQAELRAEIQPRIRQEVQAQAEQELELIQHQFQQEFDHALHDLSAKFSQIEAEKKTSANQQISTLQSQLQQLNKNKLAAAHQQLMLQKFDTDILNHPKMQQVAQQIEEQTAELLLEKYYANKTRKEKELKVRIENRSQRQRNQLDQTIRKQVTAKSGLSELRQQLKTLRVEVASEKSKCNVRIRSIISQTNQILQTVKEHSQHNLDKIINDLQNEINQLKQRKMKAKPQVEENSEPEMQNAYYRREIGQLDLHARKEHQYIYEDISFDSSRITQSQQQRDEEDEEEQNRDSEVSDSDIPQPPEEPANLHQKQTTHTTMGPLLKFDVDQLIAAEWQDDEFDRYMRNEVEKENTASNHNQPKSNFNTLYQQHLENLNHKSKNRGKVRLSQKAKEQLLENWSHQRHKF